jgi:hypothetical protein
MRNNSQLADNILALPIMQAPLLLKFLTMNFCLVIDWIGTGSVKVPDGCHLCMFMPGSLGTYPYFKFTAVEQIITAIDNMKTVSMDCFSERYQCPSIPCFRQVFEPLKDQFRSRDPATRIYHLPIDYLVYHTQAMFVKYAALFSHKAYEHMDVGDFRDLCITTLTIDTARWRSDKGCDDMGCIPSQVVAPPGFKSDVPKVAREEKYTRAEKLDYKSKQRAKPKGAQRKAAIPVVTSFCCCCDSTGWWAMRSLRPA